jgi:26S proteasome regulatory subunit N10
LNVENRKLVQLAKKLKKNNVAVDIVNFGGHDNVEKLEQFMENVNTGDNRFLLYLNLLVLVIC